MVLSERRRESTAFSCPPRVSNGIYGFRHWVINRDREEIKVGLQRARERERGEREAKEVNKFDTETFEKDFGVLFFCK